MNFQYYYSDQYASRAKVLRDSILKFYPNAQINEIKIGNVKDGYIPNLAKESLKECLNRLMVDKWDHVISIGADCELFSPLLDVEGMIQTKRSDIMIVPHVNKPVESRDYMAQLYRTGHANGDFKVFRKSYNTINILKWLIKVTEDEDKTKGIFFEQTWMSALPFLFDKIEILRHAGYNVAYWDIEERRPFQNLNGDWLVWDEDQDGMVSLRFMHYSGYLKGQVMMSKYSNKIATGNILKLYKSYDERI